MSLLRQRGFALLWCGQLLSALADWSLRPLVLIWAYTLTRSGTTVSLVGLAEALPLLVLAPVAGVFVDRWSRARTMAGAALARAALILPLLLVTGAARLPLVIAVVLLASAVSQFGVPAASAAVPVVAGAERAGQANSLLSLITGASGIVGPAGAALLFGTVGPHATIVALSALYLLAAPVLLAVPAPRPAGDEAPEASMAHELLEGLDYVRRTPLLRHLILVSFVALLGVGALSVIDVVFVTRALHLPTARVGVLFVAIGVGQLLGGLAVAAAGRWATGRYHLLLGVTVVLNGVGFVAYALAPTLAVAVVALFAVGLVFPPLIVSFTTMIQLSTDDRLMGRVMSLVSTAMAVASILSTAAGGVLTDVFGVRQVIGGAAALLIAAGILSLMVIRTTPRARVEDIDEPAAAIRSLPVADIAR